MLTKLGMVGFETPPHMTTLVAVALRGWSGQICDLSHLGVSFLWHFLTDRNEPTHLTCYSEHTFPAPDACLSCFRYLATPVRSNEARSSSWNCSSLVFSVYKQNVDCTLLIKVTRENSVMFTLIPGQQQQ